MNQWRLMVVGALAMSLLGCSGGPGGSSSGTEASASSVTLQLGTTGSNGNRYRLSPAQFNIVERYGFGDVEPIVVDVVGTSDSVNVPLGSGRWAITLNSGWELQRVGEGGALTPVAATLISPTTIEADVFEFQTTPVSFAFHLGESGIDLGVTVDEGVPPGYDGVIEHLPGEPRYSIEWSSGGGVCCFNSVAEAKASYPSANLFVVE